MKVTARIVHGTTESTFTSPNDASTARFLFAKAAEWANGRRDGSLEMNADQGRLVANFADITLFSVEASS